MCLLDSDIEGQLDVMNIRSTAFPTSAVGLGDDIRGQPRGQQAQANQARAGKPAQWVQSNRIAGQKGHWERG